MIRHQWGSSGQKPATYAPWADRLAIGASTACLVHCLLLPVLIATMPATSQWLALPEEVHLWAFATAVPVSAYAMSRGFRHHGLILPAGLGLMGLVMLGMGVLCGLERAVETGFTLAGSVALIVAHVRNWQLRGRVRASEGGANA